MSNDTHPSQTTLLNGLTGQETAASASVAGLSGAQPEAPAEPVCPACNGEGSVQAMTSHLGPDDYEYDESCIACNGTGSPDLKDALEGVGFIRHPQFPARTYISREAVMKIVDARASLATPAPAAQQLCRLLTAAKAVVDWWHVFMQTATADPVLENAEWAEFHELRKAIKAQGGSQ